MVKELLDHGAGTSIRTKNSGDTALHKACLNGHEGVVRLLLDRGVDVNTRTEIGETPLHIAARNGYGEIVQLLLDKADVTAKDKDGWTPLYSATNFGKESVIELLLQKMNQSQIAEQTKNGETALFRAAQHDYANVVLLFLKREADLVLPFLEEDADLTRSPAESGMCHTSERDTQMIYNFLATRMLLDDGLREKHFQEVGLWAARNHIAGQYTWILMDRALDEARSQGNEIKLEEKLLYAAAFCGCEGTVDWLLGQRARKSEMKTRHLEASMRLAAWNGHTLLLTYLLKESASPEQSLKKVVNGETLLHVAAGNGNEAVVKLLLDRGAEIIARTKTNKKTALHLAASNGHIMVVTELLGRKDRPCGPELVKARTADGETALSLAARNALFSAARKEDSMILELLLKNMKVMNIKVADFGENTDIADETLTWAARNNFTTLVRMLLEMKSEVDTQNISQNAGVGKSEWTALDWAAFYGNPVVVWWLLANGVSMHNKSALRIARARKDQISTEENSEIRKEGTIGAKGPRDMETDKNGKEGETGGGRINDFERVQHEYGRPKKGQPEENHPEDGKQQDGGREVDEHEKSDQIEDYHKKSRSSSRKRDFFGTSLKGLMEKKEKVAEDQLEQKRGEGKDGGKEEGKSIDTRLKTWVEEDTKENVQEEVTERGGLNATETNEDGEENQTKEGGDEAVATVMKAEDTENEKASKNEIEKLQTADEDIPTRPQEKPAADKRESQSEYQRYELTLDMLKDPPPVLEQSDLGKSYEEPALSYLQNGQIECCEKFSATIVDFYLKEDRWGLLRRSPKVSEVLYEYGAEKIMSRARKDLQIISPEAAKKRDYVREDLQFRWIHLPANNVSQS